MFEPAAVTYGISTVVYTAVLFIKEDFRSCNFFDGTTIEKEYEYIEQPRVVGIE